MISIFGIKFEVSYASIALPANMGTQRRFMDDNTFILKVSEVATYMVDATRNIITIDKATSDVTDNQAAVFLFGTVVAYLLQHKDYLVLHGSAVLINGMAVIFSGDSGAGKSTTASAFIDRGYKLLTDDVVAIKRNAHGKLVLAPGPSKVKLWDDALEKLNKSPDNLVPILNKVNKFEVPIITDYHNEETPIIAFYELNPCESVDHVTIEELSGQDKLQTIINNTYRYNMLKPLGKLQHHFKECVALVSEITTFKVTRPTNKFLIDDLITKILQTLKR